ncbi:hypothetical protein [Schwartzia succinivorans]|uniref:Import inner membrane translocase subunit Tim44 n=1 Tax=Schwartzia succinivorans DSM 10502 TaxID=1123243 RepID=A0A1M4Y5R7_9FIRM|nr:hypothetical protein [Schwartzia succinivorans]MBQ1469449.1 hypothetical protein [Schwartzia sp. (in: firmicutes)]SHF00966.1 hypothetical protein SAMN02745190_01634 [Schwartzia succinivorans DSM 10502]
MTLKKFSAFLCAVFTAFVLIGTVETAAVNPSVAYAAKGGSFRSSPSRPSTSRPSSPKPSAPKNSTQKNSTTKPAQSPAKPQTSTNRNTSGGFGGILRGIGIFAGGMMLGSLLSNLLGFGTMGGFSTILGILFNILLYGAIISVAIWAFRRLFGRRGASETSDPYHANRADFSNNYDRSYSSGTDWGDDEIPDIRPPKRDAGGADYDPKRTADWYRRH